MSNKVKELAEEHWDYIEAVLRTHNELKQIIVKIQFHYITAFEHGWKHFEQEMKAEKMDIAKEKLRDLKESLQEDNNA